MIGGEVLAAMLGKEGVDTIFGIVDGTYLGFYTAFQKYGIRLVSPRHESTAAHMAGGYARATGKLGVCMASNGPGVANALPGVAVENAEAFIESVIKAKQPSAKGNYIKSVTVAAAMCPGVPLEPAIFTRN